MQKKHCDVRAFGFIDEEKRIKKGTREWEKKASTTTTTITTKKTKKENNNLWKERVFFSQGKPRAKDREIHIENAAVPVFFNCVRLKTFTPESCTQAATTRFTSFCHLICSLKIEKLKCTKWTLPVGLYGCEPRHLTLRDEYRPKVFENRALMGIFVPKWERRRAG